MCVTGTLEAQQSAVRLSLSNLHHTVHIKMKLRGKQCSYNNKQQAKFSEILVKIVVIVCCLLLFQLHSEEL